LPSVRALPYAATIDRDGVSLGRA